MHHSRGSLLLADVYGQMLLMPFDSDEGRELIEELRKEGFTTPMMGIFAYPPNSPNLTERSEVSHL